jgi:hypothetical protein
MVMPTTASASAATVKRIGAAWRRDGGVTERTATVEGGSGVTGVETVAGTDAGTVAGTDAATVAGTDAGTGDGKSVTVTDFSARFRCRYSRARSAGVLPFLGLGWCRVIIDAEVSSAIGTAPIGFGG